MWNIGLTGLTSCQGLGQHRRRELALIADLTPWWCAVTVQYLCRGWMNPGGSNEARAKTACTAPLPRGRMTAGLNHSRCVANWYKFNAVAVCGVRVRVPFSPPCSSFGRNCSNAARRHSTGTLPALGRSGPYMPQPVPAVETVSYITFSSSEPNVPVTAGQDTTSEATSEIQDSSRHLTTVIRLAEMLGHHCEFLDFLPGIQHSAAGFLLRECLPLPA